MAALGRAPLWLALALAALAVAAAQGADSLLSSREMDDILAPPEEIGVRGPSKQTPIPELLELDASLASELKAQESLHPLADERDTGINDEKSQNVTITAFTQDDRKEFRRHPEQRTLNIVRLLHDVSKQQKQVLEDNTETDIARTRNILDMANVLKQELIASIKKSGGEVPELPSQSKTYVDALGGQWGDAKVKVAGLSKLLQQRHEDIVREKREMAWEDAPQHVRDAVRNGWYPMPSREVDGPHQHIPTALPHKKHGKWAKRQAVKRMQAQQQLPVPLCVFPCVPAPATSTAFPLAPRGVPQGLYAPVVARVVSAVQPLSALAEPVVVRATPQCPCGCPAALCPCRCKNALLATNEATLRLVQRLPPGKAVEAVEGKPSQGAPVAVAAPAPPVAPPAAPVPPAQPSLLPTSAATARPLQHGSSADCKPPLCVTG